jgi:lysophospholipase L1-like esterase
MLINSLCKDYAIIYKILETICKGDYLLIQFGHNDEKETPERHTDPYTTYQSNLIEYIESARKLGATPILLTTIQRRSFDESGIIQETHGEYPAAICF